MIETRRTLPSLPATPWREVLHDAVVPFVTWHLVLAGIATFVNSYLLPGRSDGRVEATGASILWEPWNRFDSAFYLGIAENGYSATGGPEWVFYPLFPALVRTVAAPFGGEGTATLIAALVITNLAAVSAALLLYLLVRAEWGREVARRTSLYFAALPLGFYFSAPYPEALFVLLAIGVLYLTRRHSWILAGVLAALAAATRPTGITLAAVLLCELVVLIRSDRARGVRTRLARPLVAVALVPLGLLGFMALGKNTTGSWLVTFQVNADVWGRQLAPPWDALKSGLATATWGDPQEYLFGLMNLSLLAVLGVSIAVTARRFPPTYTAMTAALAVLPLTSGTLQSMGRHTLPMIPILIGIAVWTRSEMTNKHQLVLLSFAGLGAIFLTCYVLNIPAIA